MVNIDWMHGLALIFGAVATAFFPRKPVSPAMASPAPTAPTAPTAPNPATPHPLFDTLVRVLEGKLQDLIAVESGPEGEPMFTLRVVLVHPEAKVPG